ncbi:MAG TPA: peptidase T [Bacillota bacterium]|nr:peptidase T [Bacillota bacterium]HOA14906.1 peptidase T [Bacillota bacterium]HOG52636.1 peptidase T [Bacillota bacterium]
MDLRTLLSEGIAEKFMRYCRIDTTSVVGSEKTPSSEGQWVLAKMLAEELEALGVKDVTITDKCFVIGMIPSNVSGSPPAIGLIAHMDTVEGVPGKDVKPRLHRRWDGSPIKLADGIELGLHTSPELKDAVGLDLITSDGTTLLGADDKSGIAQIMQAVCKLHDDKGLKHGDVWIAFTPDEEGANGIGHFPVDIFKAKRAYTIDGGALGDFQDETFNAINGRMKIYGISNHPGTARGRMTNAIHVMAQVLDIIPAGERPETTSDREGFIHPTEMSGSVEQAQCDFIIRDFEMDKAKAREKAFLDAAKALVAQHRGARLEWSSSIAYKNMRDLLQSEPRISDLARKAIIDEGLKLDERPIRGGTDGSRLSYMGILTPNLFTGGGDSHSRNEWACVQWMESGSNVLLRLMALWAEEK